MSNKEAESNRAFIRQTERGKGMKKFLLVSFSAIVFGVLCIWSPRGSIEVFFTDASLHKFFPAPAYLLAVSIIPKTYLHLILTMAGVWIWMEAFKIKVSWYHFIIIIPYAAIQAYASPTSIPPFLFIVAVHLIKRRYSWWGWAAGASYLFRTEMLFLLLFRNLWVAISLLTFLFIYIATSGAGFTSNSPAVFYGSLGQVPNNGWHIQYSDSALNAVARDSGYVDAWSAPGLFSGMAISAIEAKPVEYLRKCAYNFLNEFRCGFYSGLDRTPLHYPAALVFGLLFVYCFCWSIENTVIFPSKDEAVQLIIFTFFALVVLQALGQQLSRHVSIIYLPMMGMIFEKSAHENQKEMK